MSGSGIWVGVTISEVVMLGAGGVQASIGINIKLSVAWVTVLLKLNFITFNPSYLYMIYFLLVGQTLAFRR